MTRALYRAITGRYAAHTEPSTFAGQVDAVARRYGTRPPEGVSARTWRRWRHDVAAGRAPRVSARLRAALGDAQRRVRLSAARERKLRRREPRPFIGIAGLIEVSSESRRRKIVISEPGGGWPDAPEGTGLPPITGMLGPVLDAWLAGDDVAVYQAFMAPAEASIGAGINVESLTALALGDKPSWWDDLEP